MTLSETYPKDAVESQQQMSDQHSTTLANEIFGNQRTLLSNLQKD